MRKSNNETIKFIDMIKSTKQKTSDCIFTDCVVTIKSSTLLAISQSKPTEELPADSVLQLILAPLKTLPILNPSKPSCRPSYDVENLN